MGALDLPEEGSEASHSFSGIVRLAGCSQALGSERGSEEPSSLLFERKNGQPVQHLCIVEMDEYEVSLDAVDHGDV